MARLSPQFRSNLFREVPADVLPSISSTSNALVLKDQAAAQDHPEEGKDQRISIPVCSVMPTGEIATGKVVRDMRRSVPASLKEKVKRDVYALGLLPTRVFVEGYALDSMIDCGSGLDMMSAKRALELGLKVRPKAQMKVVPVGEMNLPCLGCVEDLPL